MSEVYKNCGYYRIFRQVKSCHKSKDQVTNDSFYLYNLGFDIPQKKPDALQNRGRLSNHLRTLLYATFKR